MSVLAIIIIGILMLAGIFWFIALVQKDDYTFFYDAEPSAYIFLIGLLPIFATLWVISYIFWFDDIDSYPPKRLVVPSFATIIIIIGVFGYDIISVTDPHKAYDLGNAIGSIFRCYIFTYALILKSYLGPLFTSYVLSTEAYGFINYGEFHSVPIISSFLGWVFSGLPAWISTTYLILQLGYNIIVNGIETFTDFGSHH